MVAKHCNKSRIGSSFRERGKAALQSWFRTCPLSRAFHHQVEYSTLLSHYIIIAFTACRLNMFKFIKCRFRVPELFTSETIFQGAPKHVLCVYKWVKLAAARWANDVMSGSAPGMGFARWYLRSGQPRASLLSLPNSVSTGVRPKNERFKNKQIFKLHSVSPGWGQLKHQCTSLGCEYMRDDGATENLRAQLMKLWCPWSFLTFMRSGLAIVGFHQRRSLNIVRAVEKCDLASFHKDYSWFMVSIKLIVLDVLELHQV